MPKRIQRKRTKGWKMPAGAVYVGRPTKWGNPFMLAGLYRLWLEGEAYQDEQPGRRQAILKCLRELRGFDLACWCPLNEDCHADVLLELANR